MAELIRFIVLGLSFYEYASASDPVRRTNRKEHCVVWGDGPYFGMKFNNEKDADQQFKIAKRDELVAIHYDNRFREVQRFKSHRVKAVTWHRLADWCKEEHEGEAPSETTQRLEIGSTGIVEELLEQSKQASLIAVDSERPHTHAKKVHHGKHEAKLIPEADAPDMAVRSSSNSNIAGKAGVLEQELTQLASKATGLFASIGMRNYVEALSLGGKDRSALKTRVTVMENFLAGMVDNTRSLEEELLGAAAVTSLAATPSKEQSSLKAKVESIEVKVDSLTHRLYALDTSLVITELPKIEERVASYSSKIVSMFKNLGFPDVAAQAFTSNQGDTFGVRIAAVREAISLAQRNIRGLSYEVLEHSWDTPAASPKVKGMKPQVESMTSMVDDLQHRLSELESAPLMTSIDKTEKSLSLLQARAVELSKRIGSEGSSMLETQTPQQTSLKVRIPQLEKLASSIESKFGTLENELLGGAKVPSQSLLETQSMRGRAKALEMKVEGLASRAAALEQEV